MKKFKLSEIASIENGGTPSTEVAEYWNGDIPWITPFDLSKTNSKWIKQGSRNITKEGVRNSNAKIVPARSIMVSTRAPIGYIVLNEVEATTNQGMKSVIPKAEMVDTEYLYYLLKTKVKEMNLRAGGTTFKEISTNTFKGIEVNLPSLEKQELIGYKLAKLDERIETNNLLISSIEEYCQLLFHKWFVDFNFPNENGEPYKDSGGEMVEVDGNKIPKGWTLGTIGELYETQTGFAFKSEDWTSDGIPVLTIKSIRNNAINLDDVSYIDAVNEKNMKFCVENGNIVLAMTGNTIGKFGIVSLESNIKALVNQRVCIIKSKFNTVGFLHAFLLKESTQNFIWNVSQNSAQPNISENQIRNITIFIPNNIQFNQFGDISKPLFEKIVYLQIENRLLKQYRDIIIHRLIK